MSDPVPTVPADISEQFRTNYMGVASFTILIWDHVDTFTAEVEYIWKGRKGPIGYLFLLNRYLIPLGFVVNLFAYLSPSWSAERCRHFVRYEGAMTMIGIHVVGLMMLFRIYALYYSRKWIVVCVGLLLLAQATVNAWLLTRGEAVAHNKYSNVHACTMIFDPSVNGGLSSASAWLPLLYDTVVVTLTMWRLLPSIRNQSATYVMRRLLEDGLLYYGVILAVNTCLTIMIIGASAGLKNITAQLELLITVAMMSRITLNLKKSAHQARVAEQGKPVFMSGSIVFASPPAAHYSIASVSNFSTPPRRVASPDSSAGSHRYERRSDGRSYVPPQGW